MFTDARISAALRNMIQGIDAPPVPLSEIQRKVAQLQPAPRYVPRYLRPAIAVTAVIAVVFVVFSSSSVAVIQTIEARYRAALQALGGIAPPPVPKSINSSLSSQRATLSTAQSRVRFTIIPPAGLPSDVVSSSIQTTPTAVYSKATHSWHVGPRAVNFSYRRAGGRWFALVAERFDPQSGFPPKYMFEPKPPAPDGHPVLTKYEHFAWRNGNQMMSATADEGISAPEIAAIRLAMSGIALPRRELHGPDKGTSYKFIILNR